ncbi:MAG TPA: hypothetical protein VFJ74_16320 [Gemmatimonadaceae bacterium]|nr:hypothetical protein [Gemmatimonadaceae bacterium]
MLILPLLDTLDAGHAGRYYRRRTTSSRSADYASFPTLYRPAG